jgi:DNA-binding NarL/FixJ family response regulator
MREALGAYLASGQDFAVVGQTASLDSLVALCKLRRPDVALVEIDQLTEEAVQSLCHFRGNCPETEAVVAYTEPQPSGLDAATRAGFTALVPNAQGIDAVVRMLRQRAGPVARPHRNGTALTDREMEIISLMGSGYGVPEMADLLEISRRTVENHKRRIYSKLHVGNQSHAVSRATVLGLLDAPPPGRTPVPSPTAGRPTLVVVRGPAGPSRDQVVLALVAGGQPFAVAEAPALTAGQHWSRWQRDPPVSVLIDPIADDWTLAYGLGGPAVVVLSRPPDLAAVLDTLLRGARGLLHADDTREDLAIVLALVNRGYFAIGATGAGDLAEWLGEVLPDNVAWRAEPGPPELTARERDILASIASGHTIRQTARVLGIACKTVENTQARLFRKLGAHNRSGALRTAYRLGLVDPANTDGDGPQG